MFKKEGGFPQHLGIPAFHTLDIIQPIFHANYLRHSVGLRKHQYREGFIKAVVFAHSQLPSSLAWHATPMHTCTETILKPDRAGKLKRLTTE